MRSSPTLPPIKSRHFKERLINGFGCAKMAA
jgi:hypothetical protein